MKKRCGIKNVLNHDAINFENLTSFQFLQFFETSVLLFVYELYHALLFSCFRCACFVGSNPPTFLFACIYNDTTNTTRTRCREGATDIAKVLNAVRKGNGCVGILRLRLRSTTYKVHYLSHACMLNTLARLMLVLGILCILCVYTTEYIVPRVVCVWIS